MTYFEFQPLRYKGPDSLVDVDGDDIDWMALGLPPNTAAYTVASPENGDFSIVASHRRNGAAQGTSTYTHAAAETAAQTAEALALQINADIAAGTAGTLYGFAERAIYPGSGAILYVQWKQRQTFFVRTVDPGAATLTATVSDRWPVTTSIPYANRVGAPPNTNVEFMLVALTSAGVPLARGTCTYTLEILEGVPTPGGQWTVATRGIITGAALGEVHTVSCNGSNQIGVRLTTIANEPATTDAILVQYRTVIAA